MWTERRKAWLRCLSCQHLVWAPSMRRWVLPPMLLLLPCWLWDIHSLCHHLPVYPVENHLGKACVSPLPSQMGILVLIIPWWLSVKGECPEVKGSEPCVIYVLLSSRGLFPKAGTKIIGVQNGSSSGNNSTSAVNLDI